MNKVVLIGNLTKDPELSKTNSDIAIAKFTLAVQRKFTNANGEREADFLNVVAWRGQAENVCKYLKKGSKCAIVGSIQTRSYDAQDGTKRYVTEITAEEVEFLTQKSSVEGKEEEPKTLEPIDDGLPF